MRHKSFHEYIFLVSANDVMEHFAFPGNIDFADDDQGFDVFIGHFHDDDIWLQLPEFISFLLSYLNLSMPLRITEQ